jgi:oleandomycin transport system ATP-binding protein
MTITDSPAPAISVRGLTKSYKKVDVLRRVDFDVAQGSIFALLGSNGAGKTTIVNILSTLLRASSGSAAVNGYDVGSQAAEVRESVSLTGQFAAVDEILSGRENLVLVARLRHLVDPATIADDLLERFALTEAAARKVSTYSGGMRRRLDLGASLVGEPQVLFLDEPTTGLDPRARIQVWETIRGVVAAGATVLLTTQYLEEADELADRIAVIDRGLVVADGTPAELKSKTGGQTLVVRAADRAETGQVAAIVADVTGTVPEITEETGLVTAPASNPALLPAVVRRLDDVGLMAAELAFRLPSLDEVFLTLTGHPAEDTPGSTESLIDDDGRAA